MDVLNVMEAHQSLMELENIRILKDMRNTVNRKVNCETANINKTVSAAVKQIEDIRYIEETKGLDKLPEGFQRAEFLLDKGAIDLIVDRREMRDKLAATLSLLLNRSDAA